MLLFIFYARAQLHNGSYANGSLFVVPPIWCVVFVCPLFCGMVLDVVSSLAIIMLRKRELVT